MSTRFISAILLILFVLLFSYALVSALRPWNRQMGPNSDHPTGMIPLIQFRYEIRYENKLLNTSNLPESAR